ncbi:putative clathrin assembly protein At4g40080 [Rutidosis leptorrhynchoides]|uniref:putative clathrin assembly protein At4g40080 n=1 Tax=Rutidosis leptorrhynchoides TaxID=125765 RepID=UPI003A99C597
MGHSKKLKNFHSILKDKAKIIKAKLSITNHTTSSIQIVVLRATTRTTHSPPHDHLISALIAFGLTTQYSASACISTIINRLHHHNQPNAYVALKSLITLHHFITSGSFVHKEQTYVSNTNFGFLNLSRFVDNTDMQSKEFSLWVQWYARFLETNLSISNILGCSLSSSKAEIDKKKEKLKFSLYMDLFKEIEGLVSTIEVICTAPQSLHCQRNDIIYEVMRLVREDYRIIQYHTMIRLTELSNRIHKLSDSELKELTRSLERLESCKERLGQLFLNRGRIVSFWNFESELLRKLMLLRKDREMKLVSWKMIEYATESTQLNKQIIISSRPLELLTFVENNDWSSFDKVNQSFCVDTA